MYKYNPNDYEDVLFMKDEMLGYYGQLEKYRKDKSQSNMLSLERQLNDLMLTIKHRELEGWLTRSEANEIRSYMGELLYD